MCVNVHLVFMETFVRKHFKYLQMSCMEHDSNRMGFWDFHKGDANSVEELRRYV